VDRFKREKAEDMRRTVLDYINLQVEYNKRMEHVWATLIPQLERVQLDSNSNAIPVTPEQQQQYASAAASSMPLPPQQQPQQSQQQYDSHQQYSQGNNMPAAPPPPVPSPATDPSSMISVQYRE
jgi:hypothetical protein